MASDPARRFDHPGLETAFHLPGSGCAYPTGTPERAAAAAFVPRCAAALAQPRPAGPGPADPGLARSLGLPMGPYDVARRLCVSIHSPGKGAAEVPSRPGGREAARAAAAAEAARAARAAAATLPPGLEDEYRAVLSHHEAFAQAASFRRLVALARSRASLPIAPFESEITAAVTHHAVVVLAGDTGCGKSTQVPQFLIRAGIGPVAVTQPRRLSAIALCRRVSYETLNEHGDEVAYSIRFESSRSRGTKVLFLTEGVLLRTLAGDPDLGAFGAVVLDEAHERHVDTDLLLALLKRLLARRPTLRLIIMSATINVAAFSAYFDNAPVIAVPGRTFPIKIEYVPPPPPPGRDRADANAPATRPGWASQSSAPALKIEPLDPGPYLRLMEKIERETPAGEAGDVLIFVAGVQDIDRLTETLGAWAARGGGRWVPLPLHAGLPPEDQDRVFQTPPPGVRKVVVATNVAETAVTIDGVRFVLDSGRAKDMRHDARGRFASLQEAWVSQASADQRAGRAGRTGPGHCFRLYTPAAFARFARYNAPEITRAPLEGLVLAVKALAGAGQDPRAFGFLDPPPAEAMEAAVASLVELGALGAAETPDAGIPDAGIPDSGIPDSGIPDSGVRDSGVRDSGVSDSGVTDFESLTPLGRALSALPVAPRVGKLLLLGSLCPSPVAALAAVAAAALSVPSPLRRIAPGSAGSAAVAAARREFESLEGDVPTVVACFRAWAARKAGAERDGDDGGRWDNRKWCAHRGVDEGRLAEIAKLREQYLGLVGPESRTRESRTRVRDSGTRVRDSRAADPGSRACFTCGAGDHFARACPSAPDDPSLWGGHRQGAGRRVEERRVRGLKRDRDRERGRGVLQVTAAGCEGNDGLGGSDSEGGRPGTGRAGGGRDGRSRDGKGRDGKGRDGAGATIEDRELALRVDLRALGDSASRHVTPESLATLRGLLLLGLYPCVALPDAGNAGRKASDARFHARHREGATLHPGSVLAAGDAPPGPGEVLVYAEMLETTRLYLCGVTRLPAHALLAAAARIDTDEGGTRAVLDGWVLLTFGSQNHGLENTGLENTGLESRGPATLAAAARLRAFLDSRLRRRLRRRGGGGAVRGGGVGGMLLGGQALPEWARRARDAANDSVRDSVNDSVMDSGMNSESEPESESLASALGVFVGSSCGGYAVTRLATPAAVRAQYWPAGEGGSVPPVVGGGRYATRGAWIGRGMLWGALAPRAADIFAAARGGGGDPGGGGGAPTLASREGCIVGAPDLKTQTLKLNSFIFYVHFGDERRHQLVRNIIVPVPASDEATMTPTSDFRVIFADRPGDADALVSVALDEPFQRVVDAVRQQKGWPSSRGLCFVVGGALADPARPCRVCASAPGIPSRAIYCVPVDEPPTAAAPSPSPEPNEAKKGRTLLVAMAVGLQWILYAQNGMPLFSLSSMLLLAGFFAAAAQVLSDRRATAAAAVAVVSDSDSKASRPGGARLATEEARAAAAA